MSVSRALLVSILLPAGLLAAVQGCARDFKESGPFDLDELIAKGADIPIPEPLKTGRATEAIVAGWTASVRKGEPLARRDLDADGREDLLAEILHARGATGNRSFMVFVATGAGFRYAGDVGNVTRVIAFPKTGRAYVIERANCGPELHLWLRRWSVGDLVWVGHLLLENSETSEDRKRYERLRDGAWEEDELLRAFAKDRP